jgi:hypothetical protein
MIIILFLSAIPAETEPLELIKECNTINQKIRSSVGRELFKLEQRHDISIKWLIEELLNYNPQILHFSGHGSEKSALIFKNENTGEIEEVPPSGLSEVFRVLGKNIDLVFLNACYSEKQATAIAKHVNCVIGMSDAIPDDTAIEFASTFYSSLGFGKNIQDAFDLAMIQLGLLSMSGDRIPKLIVKEGMDASKISIGATESKSSSQLNNDISNNNLSMDNKQRQHQTEDTSNNGNITVGNITGGIGIIIGKNIKTGDVIIGIDQSIKQNPQNEYLQGLKKLTENLDKDYEKNNVSEQKRTEINKSIQDLQNEVKDLKPETKVEDIKDDKQKEIKNKTQTLYQKIIDATPQAAEIIVNLTPLAPFSKFFKNGIQNAVDAYKKYKESQS